MSSYIIENGQVVIRTKTSVFVQRDPTVFIKGDPGPPGDGSAFYKHIQNIPSAIWTIVHNLNFEPQTQVFSLGGVKIEAFIQNLSLTTTQIIFSSPFSGYAILSR
jgi:hypothetical protein